MSYWSEVDARRKAERDYDSGYGRKDSDLYDRYGNDTQRAYTEEFDRQQREHERRQEERREEERREERREAARVEHLRQLRWEQERQEEMQREEDEREHEPREEDEEGCIFGDECCMPGPHTKGECHTAEMLMAAEQSDADRQGGAA